MSGNEALKHLQDITETKDIAVIAVIAVTADVMPKDMEAGIEAGFRSYITKPIDVPKFVREIEETLDSIKSSD